MYLILFNLNLNSQMAPVATVMSRVTLDAPSCPHGAQQCAGSWQLREVLTTQLAWSWTGSYLEGSPSGRSQLLPSPRFQRKAWLFF